MGAVPHFRAFTYWLSDGDPVRGWLNAFNAASAMTYEDLAQLDIRGDDVVYFNSAQPAQVMAAIHWIAALPMERQPQIVIEFGTKSGLQFHRTPNTVTI